MNWIERLLGRQRWQSNSLDFNSIPGWLKDREESLEKELAGPISRGLPGVEKALWELEESCRVLEEAEPEGRMLGRMVKTGLDNRDSTVKQIKILLSRIKIPQNPTPMETLDFCRSASQSLEVCLENSLRSYHYTKMILPEESKQVISELKNLSATLENLANPLKEKEKAFSALKKAASTAREIEDLDRQIAMIQRKQVELEKKMENQPEKTDTKIKELLESSQWKKYQANKEKLTVLENELKEIEKQSWNLISPLSKALDRLEKQLQSGRYHLKDKNTLQLLQTKPIDAEDINPFLEELQKLVEDDRLNLTPNKKAKTLEQIKELKTKKPLKKLKEKYNTLQLKISHLKTEIENSPLPKQKKELEREIQNLKEEKNRLKTELQNLTKKQKQLEKEKEKKKKQLEDHLQTIQGSRVTVEYDNKIFT